MRTHFRWKFRSRWYVAALIAQFAVGLHVDISDIPLLGGLIDLIGRRGRGRVYLGPTAYFGVLYPNHI